MRTPRSSEMHELSVDHSRGIVSRIAIGSAQFGLEYGVMNQRGQVPPAEVGRILARARSFGIDTVDTAVAYGTSEQTLGAAGVRDFRIVTKLPRVPDSEDVASWVVNTVRQSVAKLGVHKVHALLLHHPSDLEGPSGRELASGLTEVKSEGLAGKVGISAYEPNEIARYGALIGLEAVQVPLSVVDRRFVDTGTIERLHRAGIEVHVRSIFLQGLLLTDPALLPPRFLRWVRLWSSWRGWLESHGISPLEGCLAYALSCTGVDRIVVGIDCEQHLIEIGKASTIGEIDEFPDVASNELDLVNPTLWGARR